MFADVSQTTPRTSAPSAGGRLPDAPPAARGDGAQAGGGAEREGAAVVARPDSHHCGDRNR